jgi:hypothetical protein
MLPPLLDFGSHYKIPTSVASLLFLELVMPISTLCGDCRKKYTLKDEMAGKKFRCKECQSVVTVPDGQTDDEDDPFAGVDLQSVGKTVRRRRPVEEDDDDDDFDDDDRPSRRESRTNSKPVKKKRSRGPSIPVSVIIAIVIQSLLTLFPVLGLLATVLANGADSPQELGSCAGLLTRMSIALCVLIGMFQRKHSARQWSRGLCTLGLIFGAIAVALTLAIGAKTDEQVGMVMIISFQWAVWLALLICLSTDSAADWFTE